MAEIITGEIVVPNGTVLTDLSIQTGGEVTVEAGGTVKDSEAVDYGWIWVDEGGHIENIQMKTSGNVFVSGTAVKLTAIDKGQFDIYTSLESGTILEKGVGVLYTGASATFVTVSGGSYLLYGGTTENTTVQDGGTLTVKLADGLANITTVEAGGNVRVTDGASMSKTSLGGIMDILDGKVQETQILAGGLLAMSAGELRKTTVAGSAEVSSGTTYETEILTGGVMKVLEKGVIDTATVNGGSLSVAGSASGITVKTGELTVSSGGLAEGLSVEEGIVYLHESGVLTGAISVAQEAQIIVSSGGTVKFDLTETEPEAEAPVFGLSRITGEPGFTLTVNANQAEGVYRLASDAADFSGTITVSTAKKSLGTISLEDYIKVGTLYYSLQMAGGNLYFSISPDLPVPPQEAVYVNTDWTTLSEGEVVDITEELKATVGLNAFADGDSAMNAVSMDGVATLLKGEIGFLYGISRNTVAEDGVQIKDSTVTKSGVLTLKSGASASNLSVAKFGTLNVESGATLTVGSEGVIAGKAAFAEGATITINGTIAFDTAIAKGDEAQIQFGGAAGGTAAYTLTDSALAAGTYLLISGVESFEAPVQFDDLTLKVDDAEATISGDFTYKLSITENKELALKVEDYVPPPPELVYVDENWTDKSIGQEFEVVPGVTVTFGYDAFATGAAALEGVVDQGAILVVGGNISFPSTLDKVKTTTVQSGATVTGADVVHTLAVESGGAVENVSVAAGGVLTVAAEAEISGTAVFAAESSITIDGTVVFDTSFAKSDEAQFQLGVAIGGKAEFALNDSVLASGTYLLVSGVETFEDPVQFGGYTLKVEDEDPTPVGDLSYKLSITENKELLLTVEDYVPPPRFYVNSEWEGLEDGQTVDIAEGVTATIGVDAFATGDEAVAFIGGDTSISRELAFLSDGSAASLLGFDKLVLYSDNIVTIGGAFSGKSITIDATGYDDFTKKVLVVDGGCSESVKVYVLGGESFGYHLLDGTTLLVTSTMVSNTFANADWTEEDIKDQYSEDGIALAWGVNAFSSFAAAAGALGSNGTIYLEGGTSSEAVTVTNVGNDVIVTAGTAGTVAGGVSGAGGTITVENEFTTDSISGFSVLTVRAGQLANGEFSFGSVSITESGSISLAENGTLNFDLTNFKAENDPLINNLSLVTGTPNYTLTVSQDQALGKYTLAADAAGFKGSVMLDGTALSVGAEAAIVGKRAYALTIESDELVLTIGERPVPGIVYVNGEWSTLEPDAEVTIGETTAWFGYNAFATGDAANSAVAEGGTIQIVKGLASFSSNANNVIIAKDALLNLENVNVGNVNVLSGGCITVNADSVVSNMLVSKGSVASVMADGMLTGQLTTEAGATVSMDDDSCFNFDVSGLAKGGNAAFVNDFSAIKGSPDLVVTVSEEGPGQGLGLYILAEGVNSFSSSRTFALSGSAGTSFGTLTVNGEAITEGNRKYSISYADKKLALTVSSDSPGPEKPMLVYVNSEWSDCGEGEIVTIDGIDATVGYDAFADYKGASENVAEGGIIEIVGGEISFDVPIENATTVHSGVTVTGVSVSSGSLTVESGGTVITVDVAATGTLVIEAGGTVTGSAVFADGAAVTVNGTILFDTAYAQNGAVQFEGYSFIAGAPSFELVDPIKAEGTYFFVSGIETFEAPVQFGVYTLKVGDDPVRVGKLTYKFGITEDDKLALTVEKYTPSGDAPEIVYVNPDWATVAPNTPVPVGEDTATVGVDAFADGDTANDTVAAGGEIHLVNGAASFSENAENVFVSSGAELDLSTAVNVGKLTVLGGGRMVAAGGAVVDTFTLSGGNIVADVTGATAKNGIVSGLTYEEGGDNHRCSMTIGEGGLVQSAAVGTGGIVIVSSGGSAEQIILNGPAEGDDYGELVVNSGALATGVTVSSAGYLNNIGILDDLTIQGGQGYIRGIVNGAVVQNGTLGVEAGGLVSGVKVGMNGNMWAVNSGGVGTIIDTEVQDGGSVDVAGYASGTHVLGGGSLNISNHGLAEATTVDAGGFLTVGAYSMARGLTLAKGGTVTVNGSISGPTGYATLTGTITAEDGSAITMGLNSQLDFDISVLAEPIETPLLNNYAAIDGTPELFITVSPEQEFGTYLLAGGIDEETFDKTLTVKTLGDETLGTLTVDGDPVVAGDYIYYLGFMDGGILALAVGANVKVDNGPDDGWNNVLWNSKEKKPNMDIFLSEATILDKDTKDVQVDRKYSVSVERDDGITYHNFVGKIADQGFDPDTDPADYRKIKLETGARLSFSVTGQSSGKFVIYQIIESEKNNSVTYKLKSVQKTNLSLKRGAANVTAVSKAIYLEAGTYFVAMEGKIASKGDTNGFYNVELNYIDPAIDTKKQGTKFYEDDDNGDNNFLYDKKLKAINEAVYNADAVHVDAMTVIQLDDAVLGKSHTDAEGVEHVYTNFVGFGDTMDIRKIELDHAADLAFTVDTFGNADTGNAKIYLYRVTEGTDKRTGATTYTVKTLTPPTAAVKMPKKVTEYDNTFTTKPVLLESGVYFVAVESTDAKKGGEVYYTVSADGYFFYDGDDGTNNLLYDSKKKEINEAVYNADAVHVDGQTAIQVDAKALDKRHTDAEGVEHVYTNFVGFGDSMDVLKIELDHAANLTFTVDTFGDADTGNAKIYLYQVTEGMNKRTGATTYTVKTLTPPTAAVKMPKKVTEYDNTFATKETLLEKGVYFVAVESTDAKKGGEVYYSVGVDGTFYYDADSNKNDYDSKNKTVGNEVMVADALTLDPTAEDGLLRLDGVLAGDLKVDKDGYRNFVGFGDASDVARINASSGMTVSFKVTATDAVSFAIYELQSTGKLKALKTFDLKTDTAKGDIYTYTFANYGNFFIGVTATNANKGSEAYYNVQVLSGVAPSSGLAMPDWSESGLQGTELAMPGLEGGDMFAASGLADVSLSEDKSAWLNIANLA